MNNIRRNAATAWRTLGPDRLLMALSVLLVALLLVQGVRYLLTGRYERSVLKSLTEKSAGPPERDKAKTAQEYEDAVMGHGMLGSPAAKPQIKLWGVLGDSALFGASGENAQPSKVGETISSGEKVVEIRPNEVVLEKDGKRRTETLFDELKPAKEEPKPPAQPAPAAPPKEEAKPAKDELKQPPQPEGAAPPKDKASEAAAAAERERQKDRPAR